MFQNRLNAGMLFSVLMLISVVPAAGNAAQQSADSLKIITELTRRVAQLESTVATLQKRLAPTDSTTAKPEDAALAAALAAELATVSTPQPAVAPRARPPLARTTNPNIGVIGSFLGAGNFESGLERNYEAGLEEAEFSFKAAIDPYATADFFIGAGKHADLELLPEEDGHAGEEGHADEGGHEGEEGGISFELEEAYLTLLALPGDLTVKAGKFRTRFGKINETHPHAYNFVHLPIAYQHFLGGEGFVDEGVSAQWLLPNSAFFQELTLQVTGGPDENRSFARAENNTLLYGGHLKNYFDLNDDTSLELGFGALTGPNSAEADRTNMFTADLTLKWKPLRRNKLESFEWTSELLIGDRTDSEGTRTSIGWFTHARYQVAPRWFLGGMAEYAEFPEHAEFNRKGYSGILQFFATEFQKFELQGRYNQGNFFEDFFDVALRAVFVIGAHGAHQY